MKYTRLLPFTFATSLFVFTLSLFAQTCPPPAVSSTPPVAVTYEAYQWQEDARVTVLTPKAYPIPTWSPIYPDGTIAQGAATECPTDFSVTYAPTTGSHITFHIAPTDDLYGGGEVQGALRRNGTYTKFWNTDNYTYTIPHVLYQSHPCILGVQPDGSCYAIIVDCTYRGECDLREPGKILFNFETTPPRILFFKEQSPKDLLQRFGAVMGTMPLPPFWALGYQQSRYSYETPERACTVARTFREKQIPCDVIWLDIDYMHGYRVFTFNPLTFPNPKAFIDDLHALKMKSIFMIDPGVKDDPNYFVCHQGQARNLFVKNEPYGEDLIGEVWPGACRFPDFTYPPTQQWWESLCSDFMAYGMDGIWNDMNEPALFNTTTKTMPDTAYFRGGNELTPQSHLCYHNIYGFLMIRHSRAGILKARPNERPFILTRANFLGGHRYAATWTGDNASTEADMKQSIPMLLTLGLCGQPFAGADIGGFVGDPSPELAQSWFAIGTFYPFARGHACKESCDKEPWAFGEASETCIRIALQRRYRLLPYLYNCFKVAAKTGLPIMRPLFVEYPKDKAYRTEEDCFMLGDAILIVPAWAREQATIPEEFKKISLVPGDDDPVQADIYLRKGVQLPVAPLGVQSTEDIDFQRLESIQ